MINGFCISVVLQCNITPQVQLLLLIFSITALPLGGIPYTYIVKTRTWHIDKMLLYSIFNLDVHCVLYLWQTENTLRNVCAERLTGVFSYFFHIASEFYVWILQYWRPCDSTYPLVSPPFLPHLFFFLINTRCCLWWLLNKERAVFSCNLSAPESGTWHMSGFDKWCRVSVISPGMPLRCPKPQSQMLLLN